MTYQDCLDHFGSITKFAAAMDMTENGVRNWRDGIPWKMQLAIQTLTNGKLKWTNHDKA